MKQHYRAKDFPLQHPRQDFTTLADFKLVVTGAPHVLIDRKVYECIARDFEDVQDLVTMGTARQRESGFLCFMGTTMIFTDAFLPRERQWINHEPFDDSGRPQYIVVDKSLFKAYQLEYETICPNRA